MPTEKTGFDISSWSLPILVILGASLWLIPAYYLWISTINMPWSDEWVILSFVDKALSGEWQTSELLQSYMGHNYFFLRLIFWASAAYDHLNLHHLRVLNLIISGGLAYLLVNISARGSLQPMMAALFALIMAFSLRQWESLSWSMLIVQYLTLLLLLWALDCYIKERNVATACLLLVLPAFTGNGWLALASFVLVAALSRLGAVSFFSGKEKQLFGILLAGVAISLSASMVLSDQAMRVVLYITGMLGGAFSDSQVDPQLIDILGGLNMLLHLFAVYLFCRATARHTITRMEFALTVLVVFSLLNLLAALYSRMLQGFYQPDASRYFLYTMVGTVAAFSYLSRVTTRKALTLPVLAIAGAATWKYNSFMIITGPYQRDFACHSYAYLIGGELDRDGYKITGLPDSIFKYVVEGVDILRTHELSFFYSPPDCTEDTKQ